MFGTMTIAILLMLVGWFCSTFIAIVFATVIMKKDLRLEDVTLLSFLYVFWPVTGPFTFLIFTGLHLNKAAKKFMDEENQKTAAVAALEKLTIAKGA